MCIRDRVNKYRLNQELTHPAVAWAYPCLCLCLGLRSQYTYTMRLRLITLHPSQIFFTEARTLIDLASAGSAGTEGSFESTALHMLDPPPPYSALIPCLLYTSDAADEEDSVDLGGRRII
eukprot:TRINITY_DN3842_c0_g1_i5.p1 TRINITY_DN3842_c0_g1~~TRINITY_DN3842_c0_g1_i5.p1  ORF type:complete len:120 (+),score=23.89 TRINITY_DN3842_c0_g1_i5:89-448(+)